MNCLFVVYRTVLRKNGGIECVFCIYFGCFGEIVDDTAQCIRSINYGRRTINNFGALQNRWRDCDRTLKMSTSVNCVVHSNAVNHQQNPVSFHSPYNRTSSAHLGLLNFYSRQICQQIGRGLRCHSSNFFS